MDFKGMMISSQIDGRVKKCRTGALSYGSLHLSKKKIFKYRTGHKRCVEII